MFAHWKRTLVITLLIQLVSLAISAPIDKGKGDENNDVAIPVQENAADQAQIRAPVGQKDAGDKAKERVDDDDDGKVPTVRDRKLQSAQLSPGQQPSPIAQKIVPPSTVSAPVQSQTAPGAAADQQQQKPLFTSLANDDRCKADIEMVIKKNICTRNVLSSNILILDCLQNNFLPENSDMLSEGCHQAIWDFKSRLTKDTAVHDTIRTQCSEVIEQVGECNAHVEESGKLLGCLIEHMDVIADLEPPPDDIKMQKEQSKKLDVDKFKTCHTLLIRLSSIVFNDYRLTEKFIQHCEDTIQTLKCGRGTSSNRADRLTSQDPTINCLRQKFRDISDARCKHEVLRLAELQADDYHLNRAMFYACREDRERFCKQTEAGRGRVYQCLVEHKQDKDMSAACRAQLVTQQEMAQQDFKVDATFSAKCSKDIQTYQCADARVIGIGSPEILMSHVIHCLITAEHAERNSISNECLGAVHAIARQIMTDYQISPNIVAKCHEEINAHCGQNLQREGATLHCLIANAKKAQRGKKPFSEPCMSELGEIVEETDVAHDYTVDPLLAESCAPVIEQNCKQFKRSGSAVLGCLLEHLGSPTLNGFPKCQESVLSLYYFISRNWALDNDLYGHCRAEATKFCRVSKDEPWHQPAGPNSGPDTNARLVLSCLYSSAIQAVKSRFSGRYNEFSKNCAKSIGRVMRQRAVDVSLLPDVEDKCLADLAQLCSASTGPGEEMKCLQDHYDKLRSDCKEKVRELVEASQTLDIGIDQVLHRACQPAMEELCSAQMQNSDDPAEVLDCLIMHKQDDKMSPECYAAVEHHQLLQVKDISMNTHFVAACSDDRNKHCVQFTQGHEVLWCLSELIRNDTLMQKSNFRVSERCRDRVRFELFAEMEDVKLDTELTENCDSDMSRYCNLKEDKANYFECLKRNWDQLENHCRAVLFKRVQMSAVEGINVALETRCKRMLKLFCDKVQPAEKLDCLIDAKDRESDFVDKQCRSLVSRAQETKAKDVRLNPGLIMECSNDLLKYCGNVMPDPLSTLLEAKDGSQIGDGRAIECLRRHFGMGKLEQRCVNEVARFIHQSKSNYKQDLLLANNCKQEIHEYCERETDDRVEFCLRQNFMIASHNPGKKHKFTEKCVDQLARLFMEAKYDVIADRELYEACHANIRQFCGNLLPGQGRIMSCLLKADEDNVALDAKCREMISTRREMWALAAQEAPPDTVKELLGLVNESPVRSTVFFLLFGMLIAALVIGVVCGRATKRIRTDIKNR